MREITFIMMPKPERFSIVCPSCPASPRPHILVISSDMVGIRCDVCHRYFRLITREVKETRKTNLEHLQSRYQMFTVEERQRTRPRVFIAPNNVNVTAGDWATFVYRGERLVGLADQSSSYWYPIPVVPSKTKTAHRLVQILSLACILLVLLQLTRFFPALSDVTNKASGLGILLVAFLFLASPAILWSVQTLRQPKRYLPSTVWKED